MEPGNDFARAVESAADDLLTWPETFTDAHVRFDDQAFEGLVPSVSDIAWLRFAPVAAEVVARTLSVGNLRRQRSRLRQCCSYVKAGLAFRVLKTTRTRTRLRLRIASRRVFPSAFLRSR